MIELTPPPDRQVAVVFSGREVAGRCNRVKRDPALPVWHRLNDMERHLNDELTQTTIKFHDTASFFGASDKLYPELFKWDAETSEEDLARMYCEPAPYSHAFSGPPAKWINLIENSSPAARQLHRRVESARTEFQQKQDDAWGKRNVGTQTPKRYLASEAAAWARFNRQKQDYLDDYLQSASGIKPVRRRLTHKCEQCGEPGVKKGFKFCVPCAKERVRESNRKSKLRLKDEMAPRELWVF